jgi:hypothetical protein
MKGNDECVNIRNKRDATPQFQASRQTIGFVALLNRTNMSFIVSDATSSHLRRRAAPHRLSLARQSISGEIRFTGNALSLCSDAIPDAKSVPTFAGIALALVCRCETAGRGLRTLRP